MKNSKLIAIILSSIMLITFTACGSSSKKETTTVAKKSTATTTAAATSSSLTKISETLPAFSITVSNKKITNSDCAKLTVYSAESAETNSSGTVAKNVYKGYSLTDIFKLAGITSAGDGFTITKPDGSKMTYDSNYASKTTLLAITKNGSSTGGPFIAPIDSQLQSDFCGSVSSIAEVTTTTIATTK